MATVPRLTRTRIDMADPVLSAYAAIYKALRMHQKPLRFVIASDAWAATSRLRFPGTGAKLLDPGIVGDYRFCGLPVAITTRAGAGVSLESER